MATKKRKYIERTCNPHYNQLQQRNKFNLKKSNFKRWRPSLKTNYARITDDLHFRKSTTKDITMMATPTNIPKKTKTTIIFPVLRVNMQKTLYLKEENKKENEKNVYRFTTTLPPPFDKTFYWQYRPIEILDKQKLNSCGKVTCLFFFISYFFNLNHKRKWVFSDSETVFIYCCKQGF